MALTQVVRQPRFGVFTDVDGTISPIVDRPDDATITPRNKALLAELSDHIALVAAVSGRSATDIRQRINLSNIVYIGNHGFERWEDGELQPMVDIDQFLPALQGARQAIERHSPSGMWVEDKGPTLSVHYRQTADPAKTKERFNPILQDIAANHGLNLFQGRMIFELRPPVETNKGTALAQLVDEFHLNGVLFLGDDVTDVDALNMLHTLRRHHPLLAVGVGVFSDDMPSEVAEAADCLADGVDGVEALLDWLVKEVKAS